MTGVKVQHDMHVLDIEPAALFFSRKKQWIALKHSRLDGEGNSGRKRSLISYTAACPEGVCKHI